MKKVYSMLLFVVILVSLVLMVSCESGKLESNSNDKLKALKISDSDDKFTKLNVYFDGSQNEKEVTIIKEERIIKREEVLGELIMQELIKGPSKKSNLKPVLPQTTKLLSFSIKDGIAYINLSEDAKYKMTLARERACLNAISSSLKQLKCVNKVKFLIDNKNIESLGGNYDLSKPFLLDNIEKIKKIS